MQNRKKGYFAMSNVYPFRYYVIVHPLKAQYLCTISKAKRTVFATWLAAFILAIPILLVQVLFPHQNMTF